MRCDTSRYARQARIKHRDLPARAVHDLRRHPTGGIGAHEFRWVLSAIDKGARSRVRVRTYPPRPKPPARRALHRQCRQETNRNLRAPQFQSLCKGGGDAPRQWLEIVSAVAGPSSGTRRRFPWDSGTRQTINSTSACAHFGQIERQAGAPRNFGKSDQQNTGAAGFVGLRRPAKNRRASAP